MRGSALVLALVLSLVCLAPTTLLAQRYDSALTFRTITTPHFWIHFHQGEEEQARRLAEVAESVRTRELAGRPAPRTGRTHVILSGQDDVPNGWATTVPFGVIELRTVGPRPSSAIGNTRDWLELVFSHEYAHILHLDRSAGVMRVARRVFGNVPFAMPNLFLPVWQVEGVATWQESAVTEAGRVRGGEARRVLAAAARAGTFEPIDRVNGGLVTWPAGEGAYFYGALFHEYLAERFGVEALDRLATETARWPPYLGFLAYSRVFGRTVGQLWGDFAARWTTSAAGPVGVDRARQVTHDGFATASPRWRADRPNVLLYASRTPAVFPTIVELDTVSGRSRTVAEKYFGESIAARGDRLVFDELRLDGNVGLVSGLHVVDARDRRGPRRIGPPDLRIGDADVSPDGRHVVASVTTADRRYLVTLDLEFESQTPTTLVSEPGVYFSGPRWSPDGGQIVAERVRVGHHSEVVVVDVASRALESVGSAGGERHATPTWTPDGRMIVFARALGEGPFNLFAVDVTSRQVWQVTSRHDGARAPDVSADGRSLAFLGYTPRGEDVFVMPFDERLWTSPSAAPGRDAQAPAGVPGDAIVKTADAGVAADYSPWHGFVPRWWAPLARTGADGVSLGAMTSTTDALGRHSVGVAASLWSETHRAEWATSYVYRRYRPTFYGATSRETDQFDEGRLTSTTATVGVVVPFIAVRRSQQFVAAIRAERTTLESDDERARSDRHGVRLGWWFDTTRAYGYSISAEAGVMAGVATEVVRPAFGADGRSDSVAAEARYFLPVGPPHTVVALRLAGARSSGDRALRRRFFVDDQGPAKGVLSFDADSVLLYRGAGAASLVGTRALGFSADYRLPLARIERGVGVLPGFLRWAHAAAFVDAADARNRGRLNPAVAVGMELSADVVAGYALPLTLTVGASWRVDDGVGDSRRTYGFVRLGRAF